MTIAPAGLARTKPVLVLIFFALILLSASLASAQEGSRIDVFGGYSYERFDARPIGYASDINMNGWNAAITGNINLKWAVTLDGSGHYGQELTNYNYLIGPQYSFRRDKSRFFVHGLFGKADNEVNVTAKSLNDFKSVGRSLGGGGGFDYDWSPRFSIRVFQADFMHTDTYSKGQNNIRVSAGLVVHFGHIGHRRKL